MRLNGLTSRLLRYTFTTPAMAATITECPSLSHWISGPEGGNLELEFAPDMALFMSLCIWTCTDPERLELHMQYLRDTGGLPSVEARHIEDYAAAFAAWRTQTFPSRTEIDGICFALLAGAGEFPPNAAGAGFYAVSDPMHQNAKIWKVSWRDKTLEVFYPEIRSIAKRGLTAAGQERGFIASALRECAALFLPSRVEAQLTPLTVHPVKE